MLFHSRRSWVVFFSVYELYWQLGFIDPGVEWLIKCKGNNFWWCFPTPRTPTGNPPSVLEKVWFCYMPLKVRFLFLFFFYMHRPRVYTTWPVSILVVSIRISLTFMVLSIEYVAFFWYLCSWILEIILCCNLPANGLLVCWDTQKFL
jgi:hypothetical protein